MREKPTPESIRRVRRAASLLDPARALTVRGELRRLPYEIESDEEILAMVQATHPALWLGLLVLTSERVLYIRKRLLPRAFQIRRILLSEIANMWREKAVADVVIVNIERASGEVERFGLLPKQQDRDRFIERLMSRAGTDEQSLAER